MSEFPRKPSRRQKRNQKEVAGVISGMQDIILERTAVVQQFFQGVLEDVVEVEPVQMRLPPDEVWEAYVEATRDV